MGIGYNYHVYQTFFVAIFKKFMSFRSSRSQSIKQIQIVIKNILMNPEVFEWTGNFHERKI